MSQGPLVVVGDTLLDVDLEGDSDRLCPDAPVPVVDCVRDRPRPGGAGLAATLAALTTREVVLVTAICDDDAGRQLRRLLNDRVEVLPLPAHGATACKIRIRTRGQPIVRLDMGAGRADDGPVGDRIVAAVRNAGAILVSDYGRGVAANPELRRAVQRSRAPVVWDPHPRGARPVPGARLATPNESEAAALAGEPDGPRGLTAAGRRAERLLQQWRAAGVAVTLGQRGALLSVGEDTPFLAPAGTVRNAVDSCGAGDCFTAAAAGVLHGGGLLREAVVAGVDAATRYVAGGGPATLAPAPESPRAEGTLPSGASEARGARPAEGVALPAGPQWKSGAREPRPGGPSGPTPARFTNRHCEPRFVSGPPGTSVLKLTEAVRASGGTVVATGGCFDLLHAGHVGLLQQARDLGDCLVVCVNSDASVRRLKGPGRPVMPAADRARVLQALEYVDAVVVFDDDTPIHLLERLKPDLWVKGGDYAGADLPEAETVARMGGQVVLLPYLDGRSTSQIVSAVRGTEPSWP